MPAKVIAAQSAAIEHGTSLRVLDAARVPSNPHSWAAKLTKKETPLRLE
jgi:hypothetical protein